MGRLIVDGNQVYEIDEECLKKSPPPKSCEVYEEIRKQQQKEARKDTRAGKIL